VLIEVWRNEYNTIRPHSSLGYRPPAPSTIAGSATERAAVEACSAALRSPPPRVHISKQRT
jgi:putative transposase